MSRRLERVGSARIVGVDGVTLTVPAGQKWTLREVTLTSLSAGPNVYYLRADLIGGNPRYMWREIVSGVASRRLVWNTVLYEGDMLRIQNDSPGAQADWMLQAIVLI